MLLIETNVVLLANHSPAKEPGPSRSCFAKVGARDALGCLVDVHPVPEHVALRQRCRAKAKARPSPALFGGRRAVAWAQKAVVISIHIWMKVCKCFGLKSRDKSALSQVAFSTGHIVRTRKRSQLRAPLLRTEGRRRCSLC